MNIPKIYWTTITASISLALWAFYYYLTVTNQWKVLDQFVLMIFFMVNLLLLIIIREKTY